MPRHWKQFAILAAAVAFTGAAPRPSIEALIRANRHSLVLDGGTLEGDGGALVAQAIQGSRIVAIGEDHFTREIPAFAQAVCDLMADDLAALVVEAGPIATQSVAATLKRPDRLRRMANFASRYPNAVAFLDSRADNDLAAHCAGASRNPAFELIGVDQEFMGSAGLIIDSILATRLSPEARKTVLALKAEEAAASERARASGNPADLLLMTIGDDRIAEVERALSRGGTPAARKMFAALVDSHRIYQKNSEGAWDSNLVRSNLMKRQFVAQAPAEGRMLLKFGDFHMYKGVGPRQLRDLGNYVAELADGEGAPSLHILVLGLRGVHATFGGYARPTGSEPFLMTDDPEFAWLKPVAAAMAPQGWIVIDLRPFRRTRIADADNDWRRVIDGYDLLVVAPEFTPSAMVAIP